MQENRNPYAHPIVDILKQHGIRQWELATRLNLSFPKMRSYLQGYVAIPQHIRQALDEIQAELEKGDRQ